MGRGRRAVEAAAAECYSAGSVAGAVLGTAIACVLLLAAAYAFWRFYWRPRRGKHLVLVTDPENGKDEYAFDNPCFREGTPLGRTLPGEKGVSKLEQKTRWSAWSPLNVIGVRGDKRKALDDSFLVEPQVNVVALRSHDFTGLGFNICGNMRDGIYIKDVLHRGPASESGRIAPGDRIDSVRISFRHMVFEDALTILSYASPYKVQLEVENASSSRPSTLIRTKRMSSSNIAIGDRICHPFYRSQSIADLAQIGKDSLKRMQQMESIKKSPRTIKSESFNESGVGDYPTLKLSSSLAGYETRRENAGLEKTMAPPRSTEPTVVKPERTKRGTQASPEAHSPEGDGTLRKFQKFGVRVLPDPNAGNTMKANDSPEASKMKSSGSPTKNGMAEPEWHQNEQNFIIENGTEEVSPAPRKQQNRQKGNIQPSTDIDVVDGRRPIAETFYDERGIDVGPVESQKQTSSTSHFRGTKLDSSANNKHSDPEGQFEMGNEGSKESNVKQLITKGFQNLKEKFHSIDRKKSGSTSETTDDESYAYNEKDPSSDIQKHHTNDNRAAEIAKNSKDTLNKEMSSKTESAKYASNIPTNLPEEVRRAAIAAVNNRRPSGSTVVLDDSRPSTFYSHERSRTTSQGSISGDSSSEGEARASAPNYDPDSGEKMPKKSYKRKAPLPPPEGEEEVENSLVESGNNSPTPGRHTPQHPQQIKTEMISIKGTSNPNLGQSTGIALTSFGSVGVQSNNPGDANKIIEKSCIPEFKNFYKDVENKHEVATNISNEADMSNQDLDANLSDVNTESDSDVEKKSQEFYEANKSRKTKGGTKIELNSSHITIHHNPSDIAVDLENESTRKAASLGDLSRLDSEQPMSILERAVSLDLADGGTPHGTKKRKAPLPPPGDDYLLSAQDSDEGTSYKKEPRLEGAMDTFQRRRLKKSSDWGTLEEAIQQNDNKTFSDPKNFLLDTHSSHITQGKIDVPTPNSISSEYETNVGEKHSVETHSRDEHPSSYSSIIESFIISEKKHSDALKFRPVESSAKMHVETDAFKVSPSKIDSEDDGSIQANEHQQKMVLLVNPQANLTSQVTVLPATTSTYEQCNTTTGEEDSISTRLETVSSKENPHSRIISSTPLHSISSEVVSSTPRNHLFHSERTAVQSPLISSSNVGISNIHVTSTHDSSNIDPNMLITSATDPFVTAMTTADSTTYSDTLDDDYTWEQPPELPTSPIPASSSSSSYIASPSMTYITEIQVVTSTGDARDNSLLEIKAPGNTTKTVLQDANRVLSSAQDRPDSSLSSDSIGSRGDQEEMEAILAGSEPHTGKETKPIGHASSAQKNNVTVTAIRNTFSSTGGVERSRIPTRIQADSVKGVNHIEENKVKPARPPVPPRKSEMSSSLITVQVPVSNHSTSTSTSPGKFISFSSLTPRSFPQDSASGRNSSFEKWVFLDDANGSNVTKFNGLENVSSDDVKNTQPHSTVVTFPTSTPNRTQTITHIVLDTKSGNNTGKL